MAKESNFWSGVAQSLLVAFTVFLFTQLWTRKEKNERIREALFDVKSEVAHNSVQISNASTDLEQTPSSQIGPGHLLVEGLETQSIQRNLVLFAQQNNEYSDLLIKYYAEMDFLKKFGQDRLAMLEDVGKQIQNSESLIQMMLVRRDTFLVNEDKLQGRHPTLLAETERNIELASRNIRIMQNTLLKMRNEEKKVLLSRMKLAASEQVLAQDTITVIYSELEVRDLRLYRWMGYLFLGFVFSAFIPMIVREHKAWLSLRERAKVAEEISKTE